MNLKKITGIALFLFACICCFSSCNDDDEKDKGYKAEIDLSVCGQKNPAWLQHEVDKKTKNMEEFTEVRIYSLSTESEEYIAFHTQLMYSSLYPYSIRFYLCSGEEIAHDSEVHKTLYEAFIQNEFKQLWYFVSGL
ncbi:MAG: hypothetical protein LBV72_11630 [Tannerella sp.]|jgi:hypothetical protein|nr:hypothetical protein [Tannerella sp.]